MIRFDGKVALVTGSYGGLGSAVCLADPGAKVAAAGRSEGSRLDLPVNCVGLKQEAKAEEIDEKRWDCVVDANLKSAVFQAQAAARHTTGQGGGKQAHIGRVLMQLGLRGRGYAAYCAAMGSFAILCKQLAAEWRRTTST